MTVKSEVSVALKKHLRENGEHDLAGARKSVFLAFDFIRTIAPMGLLKGAMAIHEYRGASLLDVTSKFLDAILLTESFIKFYPDIESMIDWIEKTDMEEWSKEFIK